MDHPGDKINLLTSSSAMAEEPRATRLSVQILPTHDGGIYRA